MKNYRVILHFHDDFDFEEIVQASGKTDAQAKALKLARDLGWRKPVKKYQVLEHVEELFTNATVTFQGATH